MAQTSLHFPKWVPAAARSRIDELHGHIAEQRRIAELNPPEPMSTELELMVMKGQPILSRLATRDLMKTDVWPKLPRKPEGVEGQIVDAIVNIFAEYSLTTPPLHSFNRLSRAKKLAWIKRYTGFFGKPKTYEYACISAEMLSRELTELKPLVQDSWNRYQTRTVLLTIDQAIKVTHNIALILAQASQEQSEKINSIPRVGRALSDKSKKVFFAKRMSAFFEKLYGKPLDPVVTALTEVVFDERKSVNAGTTRARRKAGSVKNLVKK